MPQQVRAVVNVLSVNVPSANFASAKVLATALLVLASGCARQPLDSHVTDTSARDAPATFVGREACASCHQEEDRLWQGSHHDLAMQEVDETTVLGAFDGRSGAHLGDPATFFRRDDDFYVRTTGGDGEMRDFAIAYTFGAMPLQQYLVAFPDGRYQALAWAWDSRPAGDGGQRWFHLYDEAIAPGDALHWSGGYQNWNSMCGECHSTGFEKNFDFATRRFNTTFAEIDVACEACHGPGSRHADWADNPSLGIDESKGLVVDLVDPGRDSWALDPLSGKSRRVAPLPAFRELETCGRCHARRTPIVDDREPKDGRPLLDTHRLALLDEPLYHADGQIREEVYVVGSFMQSKMHGAGVTCSDCHEPHSLGLRAMGNDLCGRCHLATQYDTPAHHFHQDGGAGSSCVDCHMPSQVYMGVDSRRDHSLRVPRPDLSLELGTPNACNSCHGERSPRWAADTVASWYGPERKPHYGEALAAGREGRPGAHQALIAAAADSAVPAIARGTALALLRRYPSADAALAIERALADDEPLVRLGAVIGAEAVVPEARRSLVSPLLADPLRAVRIEAARVLATVPLNLWTPSERNALALALAELEAAEQALAERPEAHLNRGWLAAVRGELDHAELAFRAALSLDPLFVPAYVNFAELERQRGRDAAGEPILRKALEVAPEDANVHHALGLLLVRQKRLGEALPVLARAVELAPREERFAEVYRAALDETNFDEPRRDVEPLALRPSH